MFLKVWFFSNICQFSFNLALKQSNQVKGKIAIVERGDCTFVEKARKAQNAGKY